jgi:hypothetical protein
MPAEPDEQETTQVEEVRLIPVVRYEAAGDRWLLPLTHSLDWHAAFDEGITEAEAKAAHRWIIGIRDPYPKVIGQGRLLDKFRRKLRAAFKDNNE